MSGTGEFGGTMDSMPKQVVSSTIKTVDWTGSRLITATCRARSARSARRPGRTSMLHTVVLGTGRRLFTEQVAKRALDLAETKRFSSGIVVLEYPATSA